VIGLGAANAGGGTAAPAAADSPGSSVTGTTYGVDITMQTADGGTSQLDSRALPLSSKNAPKSGDGITQTMKGGSFFYISAQNIDDTGSVEVDGQVVKTATSDGAYVIASCSGTV
jgi:hypothetical protein